MRKFQLAVLIVFLAISNAQLKAFADTDPFPGVATGGEIPGTRVSGQPGISCPAGSGVGIESNVTTHEEFSYCVKTWRPSADINADAAFRAAQDAAIAAATAESQAWNAANPGKQKCVQWGPIVHANGVSTASGGVCANPVAPGAGATVPSQSSDSVVGPSSAPTGSTSSTPAVIPTNETSITSNGSPYTKIIPGQHSTSECPAGFQAANGIIAAIGTGTFTECWPDLAWKANRLGGAYWEQFKASGGTYDVTAVIDALAVIADYKSRAKAVAQAAADLTPGIQRCSTWSVYGQTGEECAYAYISPNGINSVVDTKTVTTSDTSTVSSSIAIDTTTASSLNTNNLDSSTAAVTLVPVVASQQSTTPVSASGNSSDNTSNSQPSDSEASSDAAQTVPVTADLSAKQFKGKVVLTVSTNMESQTLTITATKKGGKTVEIPLVTNSDGDRTISSKLNLAGYTLTLKSGDQVLDKFVLKK